MDTRRDPGAGLPIVTRILHVNHTLIAARLHAGQVR